MFLQVKGTSSGRKELLGSLNSGNYNLNPNFAAQHFTDASKMSTDKFELCVVAIPTCRDITYWQNNT